MARAFAEIAFTPAVRAAQEKHGSAKGYAGFLAPEMERGDRLGRTETDFIGARDGFYQASVSETGWPYVQFRGGSKGFVKVLDYQTIAYANFRGNRQYISVGNLSVDDRISLILMDYVGRRRLKLWGRARLVAPDDDPNLIAALYDKTSRARVEHAVVITVEAFDWNCPQHIPKRLTLEELDDHIAPLREELERLINENTRLRTAAQQQPKP